MARSDTVGTAVFAAILIALGVFEIVGDATGWANGGAWWYFQGAGLVAGGWFAARSRRTVTWADDAGLRLRGMFRTREVPWSQVRYIRARPDGRKWIVEAGLVDGTVKLPGTVGRPDRTRQFAADLTAVNPGEQWLAIGLDLTAVPAAEGSRQTPLLVTESLRYRANWGLPGMTGTDQTRRQRPRRHHPADRHAHGRVAPARPRRQAAIVRRPAGLRPRRRPLVRRHQPPSF
jgi:hypothetical protein